MVSSHKTWDMYPVDKLASHQNCSEQHQGVFCILNSVFWNRGSCICFHILIKCDKNLGGPW